MLLRVCLRCVNALRVEGVDHEDGACRHPWCLGKFSCHQRKVLKSHPPAWKPRIPEGSVERFQSVANGVPKVQTSSRTVQSLFGDRTKLVLPPPRQPPPEPPSVCWDVSCIKRGCRAATRTWPPRCCASSGKATGWWRRCAAAAPCPATPARRTRSPLPRDQNGPERDGLLLFYSSGPPFKDPPWAPTAGPGIEWDQKISRKEIVLNLFFRCFGWMGVDPGMPKIFSPPKSAKIWPFFFRHFLWGLGSLTRT